MSHHLYTTPALILSSRPLGERDRRVTLLTRELGVVSARVGGVRREGARLQGALRQLALVSASLVKGKQSWRLTTATLALDAASLLRGRKSALQALARVSQLLERLIRGEDPHTELFDDVKASVVRLVAGEKEGESIEGWEIYTVSRILYHLGYLSKDELPADSLEALARKKELVALINSGIRQSGLS